VLPPTLADTGLFADPRTQALQADVIAFSPQYPLWSDGADKQRWLRLPAGTTIDARVADAWVFPVGTQLWKSFLHGGRAVETRYLERRADGRWRYAVYLWNEAGTQATLAPARGAVLAVPQAPGGRYDVPGRADCLACHDSAAPCRCWASPRCNCRPTATRCPRTPTAGGPVDLQQPGGAGPVARPAGAAAAAGPAHRRRHRHVERAALGYLHGNCGHCHNDDGSPRHRWACGWRSRPPMPRCRAAAGAGVDAGCRGPLPPGRRP
jgi:hypothetical protein